MMDSIQRALLTCNIATSRYTFSSIQAPCGARMLRPMCPCETMLNGVIDF